MKKTTAVFIFLCLLFLCYPTYGQAALTETQCNAIARVTNTENGAPFPTVYETAAGAQTDPNPSQMFPAFLGAAIFVILILLALVFHLIQKSKKLQKRPGEFDNLQVLSKTFIDAYDNLIYLKDENLNYQLVNVAFQKFFGKTAAEIIGRDDFSLFNETFAQQNRITDHIVLEKKISVTDEVKRKDRTYKTTKFPIEMQNGKTGVGAYIKDITEEQEQGKKQGKIMHRNNILVDVLNRSFDSRQEQLDYVLHKALDLTESRFGYLYLYDEGKREFTLNSWTRDVMDDCKIVDQQTKYHLEKTGIWGEVVRQRKPIVVNRFQDHHPLKKGYPEGHVQLSNFMSIPVIIDDKIVAVVGLANKNGAYDDMDIFEITVLMSGMWNSVKRKEAVDNLTFERNKYLQTLISIGDGVMVVNIDGKIEMLNQVAQELTGWPAEEAVGKHYREVFVLYHEEESNLINDPVEDALKTDTIQELKNHAMLLSKNGAAYYLEDSAAPIKDEHNVTVGIVLVFRDVTEKKEQRQRIEYLSFHDSLTGLYNRRFFEEEMQRLDSENNLPISIIMGDINGLKLTNDVFGHANGDLLLRKVADVFRKVCRKQDIISRWGGDEFVILLPKTNEETAAKIIARIKEDFSQEHIKAIKGSISMSFDTKSHPQVDMLQILVNAEEKMYAVKTLEKDEIRYTTLSTIIDTLHDNIIRERDHSIEVSRLCENFGQWLQLPKDEVRKLKEAGFLHDIGKIVINPALLTKNCALTNHEWSEIKGHSINGYRILNAFNDTMDLSESVLAHHERWDGTGYPKGLKNEEISKTARIIAIAESYDRMIHEEENKMAISKDAALQELRANAGSQFDPALVKAFISMLEEEARINADEMPIIS